MLEQYHSLKCEEKCFSSNIINSPYRGLIAGQDIDFRIEPVRSSPGLYYQSVGTARLYSTEWKVVTYLSLEGASNNVDAIRKYIDFTVAFCVKHSSLWQPDPLICNNLLDTIEKE